MEGTVKARLFLTGALFVFVLTQAQAQVTLDISKITCNQLLMGQPVPSKYTELWLSGYYNGKLSNTMIDPDAISKNYEKVESYCAQHGDMTVMDAVKNVLGADK
jgi:acid stress chaperone HdeB